jgi:hypothetical protein
MISVHPHWAHCVQARLLDDLDALGATVEINEDGMMRATWPADDEAIQSSVIVKLQLLPVIPYGAGWEARTIPLRYEDTRFVAVRQLKRVRR